MTANTAHTRYRIRRFALTRAQLRVARDCRTPADKPASLNPIGRADPPTTVAQVFEYWLADRQSQVKKSTWDGYKHAARYIIGPLLVGSKLDRHRYTRTGRKPSEAKFAQMLGPVPIAELTTADLRMWHKALVIHVSNNAANVAKKHLRAALALVAEDFRTIVPPMPSRTGRGRTRPKKNILTRDQISILLKAAIEDKQKGIYYAFPFLTGVRPSEQLALQWQDIDLAARTIHIRRMQEPDGTVTDITKTAASTREIPISSLLVGMLGRWNIMCPVGNDKIRRVFPCLGCVEHVGHKKRGNALSYTNFRQSYWFPIFKALRLPYVTPHSARHAFISTLQSKGIEIGLVAKLAGHADPAVTLDHYTQAVRGGEAAINALEEAYSAPTVESSSSTERRGWG